MEEMRVFVISEALVMQALNALQDAIHTTRSVRQVNALMHALSQLPEYKKEEV